MTAARGFTLLELLLATVLSVMLMLGVLAVVTDLSTDPETIPSRGERSGALQIQTLDAWVRLLRGDLTHAIQVDAETPSRVEMLGSGALDEVGRSRTHRPVKVIYSLETLDGRRWLVRRQTAQDSLVAHATQRDLVCRGVRKFELIAEGSSPTTLQDAQPASGVTSPTNAASGDSSGDDQANAPEEASREKPNVDAPADAVTEAPDHARNFDDDDKAHLEFGRAGGFDTVYNKSSGEISIFVNGLWFYPRYAPKWAREKYYTETGRKDPAAKGSSPSGDANAPDGEGSAGSDDGHDASDGPSSVGVTWRIRVWFEDTAEPGYDRIVTVQLSGGA
ncbi:MAG: hypothetical protein ACLFVH_04430 [Phycisphaerae bacterium]